MIQIGALLVLAIGGANVMNLLLARGRIASAKSRVRAGARRRRGGGCASSALESHRCSLAHRRSPLRVGLRWRAARFEARCRVAHCPFVAGWTGDRRTG